MPKIFKSTCLAGICHSCLFKVHDSFVLITAPQHQYAKVIDRLDKKGICLNTGFKRLDRFFILAGPAICYPKVIINNGAFLFSGNSGNRFLKQLYALVVMVTFQRANAGIKVGLSRFFPAARQENDRENAQQRNQQFHSLCHKMPPINHSTRILHLQNSSLYISDSVLLGNFFMSIQKISKKT